jgi:hypothetical protein
MPHTLAAADERKRLVAAVTNMAMSQPPLVFANRFLFTTDMVRGGQGIVVFARNSGAGMHHIAIKCTSHDNVAARIYFHRLSEIACRLGKFKLRQNLVSVDIIGKFP